MTLLTPHDAIGKYDAQKSVSLHKQYHPTCIQAIDIGANIGNYTIEFSQSFDSVIAFEPNKDVCKKILDIPNCTLFHDAISNSAGPVEYYKFEEINTVNTINQAHAKWYEKKFNQKAERISLQTSTIDSYNFTPCLIKIDVEGVQHKVLEGAINTILEHKPTLIVDCQMLGPKYNNFINANKDDNDKMDDYSMLFDIGYVNMTEAIKLNKKATDCFVHTSRIAEILVNSSDGRC